MALNKQWRLSAGLDVGLNPGDMTVPHDNRDTPETLRIANPPALAPTLPAKKRKRKFLFLLPPLAVVVVGLVLSWIAYEKVGNPVEDAITAVTTTPLEQAKQACASTSPYAVIGDSGNTLIIDTRGEEQPGMTQAEMQCMLDELEVSDAVMSEIGRTRALDGKQAGDWDQFHASWSYHPNSGVSMTITLK
jgi:hypothetical protein